MDSGAGWATVHGGHKQSDTTQWLKLSLSQFISLCLHYSETSLINDLETATQQTLSILTWSLHWIRKCFFLLLLIEASFIWLYGPSIILPSFSFLGLFFKYQCFLRVLSSSSFYLLLVMSSHFNNAYTLCGRQHFSLECFLWFPSFPLWRADYTSWSFWWWT